MSDTAKSGYEIRRLLLHLAKDILTQNTLTKFEASGRKNMSEVTTEDVIKEAEKLYEFVQKK